MKIRKQKLKLIKKVKKLEKRDKNCLNPFHKKLKFSH